jgi:hypothetical protein
VITVQTSPEQENRLIAFVGAVNKQPFQAVADNCSDFVERGLSTVFEDAGLRFRPRIVNVADVWVANPLRVATDFLSFARHQRLPLQVEVVPMIAGTRRPTAPIRSMLRGALVPDPSQGKLMFGVKVAINILNPLLGAAAYGVDKLSRFADLEQLAHERAGGELSRLTNETETNGAVGSLENKQALRREQVRVFGTSVCWKAKEEQFAQLAARGHELEVISAAEGALLLKRDRPFLLPQYYTRTAGASGASRPEIGKMADSDNLDSQLSAFRTMLAVINYNLSSDPVRRRDAEEFDADWELFLHTAEMVGLRVPEGSPARDSVVACSCREFDSGTASRDAFADRRNGRARAARFARALVFARAR